MDVFQEARVEGEESTVKGQWVREYGSSVLRHLGTSVTYVSGRATAHSL